MLRGSINHLDLTVTDPAASEPFYRAVLDRPAGYPHYAPGYYAVFFADPDGLKFEFVHMPNEPEFAA